MTNIGIKMTLDASQVASVANTTKDAFLGMADAMKKAEEAGDWGTVSSLAGGLKDLRSASGGVVNSDHAQQAQQTKQNASFGNGVLSTINQAPGFINTMGRGDFAGTAIYGMQGAGNLSRSAGKFFGEKAEEGSGLEKMSGLLKGVGFGALAVGGAVAGGNALSEQWEKVMQPAMQMNAMLKNTTGGIEENSKNILAAFDRAAAGANKFGYAAEEGMQVVMDLSRYGKTENNGVYDSESKILGFERSTNASRGNLTKYEGAMQRYGGGKNALETAYGGTLASGLQKGQFEEFLTSVERIFQEGISKGFVKGANEIASDLTFLSKLSGGSELWKGEQGAQKYTQMSNAISNATSLSSATDILTFRAASKISGSTLRGDSDKNGVDDWRQKFGSSRGNDYVDTMVLMEGGLSPELLKEQKNIVQSLEGKDNRTGQIERYKQMFGLNYTGAAQLYEKLGSATDDDFKSEKFSGEVKALSSNPEYKSNELKLLFFTEKLSTDVAEIGKTFMGAKVDIIANLGNIVAAINGKLNGDVQYGIGSDDVRGVTQGLYGEKETDSKGKSYRDNVEKSISGWLSKGLDTTERKKMGEAMSYLKKASPEELDYLNNKNIFDVSDSTSPEQFIAAFESYQKNKPKTFSTSGSAAVASAGLKKAATGKKYEWYDYWNKDKKDLVSPTAKTFIGAPHSGNTTIIQDFLQSELAGKTNGNEDAMSEFFMPNGAGKDFFNQFDSYYDDEKIDDVELKYLEDRLKDVLKQWQIRDKNGKTVGALADPGMFQIGASTAGSEFVNDWNTDSSSTFARASRNSDTTQSSSSKGEDGLTPDLVRRLVASMDGLAARFDKGLVVDAYGSA